MTRPAWVSLPLFLVFIALAGLVGAALRSAYAPEWRPVAAQPGRPWAVEADCYSQLARVQRILDGQGLVQNHFSVENWPVGLVPSTTSTFDYVLLALAGPLALVTDHPLDWAGALISPLLALGLALFWSFFRSMAFRRSGRAALVAGLALVPALVWATSLGRPRHQSLIVFLLALALTAEYERWESPRRGWHLFAGLTWGFACWTSLYEPLFALTVLVVFNLAVRRREHAAFGLGLGGVLLVALAIEGVHVFIPPPETREALARWLQFIAEMRGMNQAELGGALPVTLVVIGAAGWLWFGGRGSTTDRLLIVLTLLLSLLALFQRRWLYYACLTELFLFARFFQAAPWRGTRLLAAVVALVDLAYGNFGQLASAIDHPPNQPSLEMAQLARAIDAPGGILAPWWISPGLLYFSGHPIVSGSSHCGISGIVASARFFASVSWPEAARILRERRVGWVVVWDEPTYQYPLLASSQQILGLPVSTDNEKGDADLTVAQILITDRQVPPDLQLRAVTPHLKLYRVLGTEAGAASVDSSSTQLPVAVK